jgi:ribosomal protein S18 acetylase RimI-like enzyme
MKKLGDDAREIIYRVNPEVTNEQLNPLFASARENYTDRDFTPVHRNSLCYVCAFHADRLVGYVNLAWDGASHGFILDTTVHKDYRHQGIGSHLVKQAVEYAREKKLDWVHVDFEAHLHGFYFEHCGFRPTDAGLIRVKN